MKTFPRENGTSATKVKDENVGANFAVVACFAVGEHHLWRGCLAGGRPHPEHPGGNASKLGMNFWSV